MLSVVSGWHRYFVVVVVVVVITVIDKEGWGTLLLAMVLGYGGYNVK